MRLVNPLLWTTAAVVAIAVAPAVLPVYWLFLGTSAMVTAIALLGLGIVSGRAGMISLCQLAFAAVGAWVVDWLSVHSAPGGFYVWLLLGGAAAVPLGLLIGLPALRLRGIILAVTTLGFAAAGDVVLAAVGFTGGLTFQPVLRPPAIDTDAAFFVFSGLVFVALSLVVGAVGRSRLGTSWLVVRHSERAAAAAGASVPRSKLWAFALGAFAGGISGGLLAAQVGQPVVQSFDTSHSLGLFVLAVMVGARYPAAALFGGMMSVAVPEAFQRAGVSQDWATVLFAAGAVQALVSGGSVADGVRATVRRRRGRRGGTARPESRSVDRPSREGATVPTRPGSRSVDRPNDGRDHTASRTHRQEGRSVGRSNDSHDHATAPTHRPENRSVDRPTQPPQDRTTPALSITDLRVTFGTVVAVDGASLVVPQGTVVGLIGPNGAGKSTLVDAVTGFVRPDAGTVSVLGRTVDGLPPHRRAALGLRRTFQQERVPTGLTVRSYVRFAARRALPDAEIDELAAWLGSPPSTVDIGDLDVVSRRLVEVAGALLARPTVLILDEPAAGLARDESAALAGRLAEVPARFGTSVLLIEHDLDLVRAACGTTVVVNFGAVVAAGPAAEVLRDDAVKRVYVGG